MKINVLGGTGFVGTALVSEASGRGHDVTVFSRSEPSRPREGVQFIAGSVLDRELLEEAAREQLMVALSPRGVLAQPGALRGVLRELAGMSTRGRRRLGIVGGVGSVVVEPGPKRVVDLIDPQDPVRREAEEMNGVLTDLVSADDGSLDWFFVSPPAHFGRHVNAPIRGRYIRRNGRTFHPFDSAPLSVEDFALAVIDELEEPSSQRQISIEADSGGS